MLITDYKVKKIQRSVQEQSDKELTRSSSSSSISPSLLDTCLGGGLGATMAIKKSVHQAPKEHFLCYQRAFNKRNPAWQDFMSACTRKALRSLTLYIQFD
jgi:hypothetical protein